MKDYSALRDWKFYVLLIGLISICCSIVWQIYTSLHYWEIALSLKLKIIYFWKPTVLMVVGIVCFKIGYDE